MNRIAVVVWLILIGVLGGGQQADVTMAQAQWGSQGIRYGKAPCLFPANDIVYPEGIAYHPGTGAVFVGSATTGAVYRGNVWAKHCRLLPFLAAGTDGRTTALGMKVDSQGVLWIAGGQTGKIWMYDAVTGKLLLSFNNGVDQTVVNDVAIAPDGAAYFTDSLSPYLYRVAADAQGHFQYELWLDVNNSIMYQEGFNMNGIAATADGRYLIVVQSNTGKLFRISRATKAITPIHVTDAIGETDASFTGGDGLYLIGPTLYIVRNSAQLLVKVQLAPDVASGRVIRTVTHSSFAFPTTLTKVGQRLLVVNSQFDTLITQNPSLPFTVSNIPIP